LPQADKQHLGHYQAFSTPRTRILIGEGIPAATPGLEKIIESITPCRFLLGATFDYQFTPPAYNRAATSLGEREALRPQLTSHAPLLHCPHLRARNRG